MVGAATTVPLTVAVHPAVSADSARIASAWLPVGALIPLVLRIVPLAAKLISRHQVRSHSLCFWVIA